MIEGYRIGAKPNDELKCLLSVSGTPTEKKARIIAPDTAFSSNEVSYQKENTVGRVGTANSISSNVLTFTAPHKLIQVNQLDLPATLHIYLMGLRTIDFTMQSLQHLD